MRKEKRTWKFWVSLVIGVPLILLEYAAVRTGEILESVAWWAARTAEKIFHWSNRK